MAWLTGATEHQQYVGPWVLQDPLEISSRTGGLASVWENQSPARCSLNLYATTRLLISIKGCFCKI